MILAPATMAAEKDPKEAVRKCLEEIQIDPEGYRIGHTKARDTDIETFCDVYWILLSYPTNCFIMISQEMF